MGRYQGHTLEWTQIKGGPCELISGANSLTVTYEQSPVRDDKVFRLTVDKGQKKEKTFDVDVYSTPIEIQPWPLTTSERHEFDLAIAAHKVLESQIQFLPALSKANEPQSIVNGTKYMMWWTPPSDSLALVKVTLEENATGQFAVVYTPPLTAQYIYTTVNKLASYRVKTTFIRPNRERFTAQGDTVLPNIGNYVACTETATTLSPSTLGEFGSTRTTRSLILFNQPNTPSEVLEQLSVYLEASDLGEFSTTRTTRSLKWLNTPFKPGEIFEPLPVYFATSELGEFGITRRYQYRSQIGNS